MAHQIRLDLDDESAARLAALAERAHAQQEDLAVTLLSGALAELEREASDIASTLSRIPGTNLDPARLRADIDEVLDPRLFPSD